MTNTPKVHRSIASLTLPTKVRAFITHADGIAKAMTNATSRPIAS
jgi:hypothetical protein